MIFESLRMAFNSILSNKMRSFLTMLGIIIGVVAVVVLISLVNGATTSVTSQIEGLGSNLITVTIKDSRYHKLTTTEIASLPEQFSSIGLTAPSFSQFAAAKNGSKSYDASIQGTIPSYQAVGNLEIQYGRFLKTPDLDNQSCVAVIGTEVADELFGKQDAVGEQISIDGRSFEIVGVLEESSSSINGSDQKIIIPFTLIQRIYSVRSVSTFYVSAADSDLVDQAQQDVTAYMMAKYRQDDTTFSIMNQSSILNVMASVTSTLTLLLGGIAAISLLVGGIGIMNIMLVSVTERTREIGIRKAIGASRKKILTQFLIESIMISLLGGILGILFSGMILSVVTVAASMSFSMTGSVIALAVGFSICIGVVFGLYPANKASRLHPIEALRTE